MIRSFIPNSEWPSISATRFTICADLLHHHGKFTAALPPPRSPRRFGIQRVCKYRRCARVRRGGQMKRKYRGRERRKLTVARLHSYEIDESRSPSRMCWYRHEDHSDMSGWRARSRRRGRFDQTVGRRTAYTCPIRRRHHLHQQRGTASAPFFNGSANSHSMLRPL